MSKKKKIKKTSLTQEEKVFEEPQLEQSNTLILGGIFIAMCSIALLIFVLSEKIFHLN